MNPYQPPANPLKSPRSATGRTPGERAFDRCFLPFVLFIAASVFRARAEHLTPIASGLALAGCLAWLWALGSVVRAWRDPAARWLLLSALGILFLFSVPLFCTILSRI